MVEDREHAPQASNEPATRAGQADAWSASSGAQAAHLRPGDPGHAGYPLTEAAYWREAHVNEPYHDPTRSFADYATAYELGWVSYSLYGGEFDTAERVLANDWMVRKGVSTLTWDEARPAVRAAWQRAENARSFVTDGSAAPQDVQQALRAVFDGARDGELGFREAAAHARSPELQRLFETQAAHCAAAVAELQQHIERLGGPVEEGGTMGGAAQRVWLQIRGLFGAAGDETMLAECGRGQDDLLEHYRDALRRNLPLDLHATLQRQFEQAQRQRDHLKRLREEAMAARTEQPA
jgi:uncharacterized protein (TIGR02284 family)